jgi:hypothetical protein
MSQKDNAAFAVRLSFCKDLACSVTKGKLSVQHSLVLLIYDIQI